MYKCGKPSMISSLQQFPFITAGQPGFVMAYGPQPVVVHPSVAAPAATHVPFSQAHQVHAQPSMFEQFQGAAVEAATLQQPQIPSTLPHQPFVAGDHFYSHYMHAQHQQGVFQQQPPQSQQQQGGSAGSIRHNSVNSVASGPPHQQHQSFQPGGTVQNTSVPPNGQCCKLFGFDYFLCFK
ncbi:unnamed protein product [Wuchereria bancrofti]|nr:unnamed protein product [Wuchereria bancrofti]